MARQKLVLTYEDYLKMPDDRTRKQIIGGDLYVTAAPSPLHQRVVVELTSILHAHAREHGLGTILVAPVDLVLSQVDVVQPDILFVAEANRHIIGAAAVQGVPDLVIEVLSPSTLKIDRDRKMDLYARAGIPEYWIVDPDSRAAELYRLAQGAYRLERCVPDDDVIRSTLFPGLAVGLHNIWNS